MKIIAKPIRMIAVFWPDKSAPIPYKFKYEDRDGKITTVKIDKILYNYTSHVVGVESIIYQCQSHIDGIDIRYEIKYLIANCQWILYKI